MELTNLMIVPDTGVIVAPDINHYLLNVRSQDIYLRLKEGFYDIDKRTAQVGNSIIVALPIHPDTISILGNLGFDIRGMEPYYFRGVPPLVEGKYVPLPHQVQTTAFLSSRPRAFCGSTPRTGKTYSSVAAAEYLTHGANIPGSTLIVCTVTNLDEVWVKTIEETYPDATVGIIHCVGNEMDNGLDLRRKILAKHADYYITNYDGIKMLKKELIKAADDKRITKCIIDELTHYGNENSDRYQAMERVINKPHAIIRKTEARIPYVWGLSGSLPDDVIAVYCYLKLINPWRLPCDKWESWKYMVQEKWGKDKWQVRIRADASETVAKFLQPTIRFNKEAVMPDIAPTQLVKVKTELSDVQRRYRDGLKERLILHLEGGGRIDGSQKSALVHKLYQIALGTVKGVDNLVVELDNSPRLATIIQEIHSAQFKTVIFGCYTDAINRLVRDLNKAGIKTEKIDGSVSRLQRKNLIRKFLERSDTQVIVCHPTTTAFGAEMASASTFIFDGPPIVGSFKYGQAKERGASLKQRADTIRLVQLYATDEELKAFDGLDAKQSNAAITNGILASISGRPIGSTEARRPPKPV